jgi:hypothetical protein
MVTDICVPPPAGRPARMRPAGRLTARTRSSKQLLASKMASAARLTRSPARSGPGSAPTGSNIHRVYWPETGMGQGTSHQAGEPGNAGTASAQLATRRRSTFLAFGTSTRPVAHRSPGGRAGVDPVAHRAPVTGRFNRNADAGGVTLQGSRARARARLSTYDAAPAARWKPQTPRLNVKFW